MLKKVSSIQNTCAPLFFFQPHGTISSLPLPRFPASLPQVTLRHDPAVKTDTLPFHLKGSARCSRCADQPESHLKVNDKLSVPVLCDLEARASFTSSSTNLHATVKQFLYLTNADIAINNVFDASVECFLILLYFHLEQNKCFFLYAETPHCGDGPPKTCAVNAS